MKKLLTLFLTVFFLFGTVSCAPEQNFEEGIFDPDFQKGFFVSNINGTTGNFPGMLTYNGTCFDPYWRVAQWWCKYDLAAAQESFSNGFYEYRDQEKVLSVNPDRGEIYLELDGRAVYGETPRREGENWPSLLLDQYFGTNLYLHQLEALFVCIDFKIECIEDFMNGLAQENLHSAQFQWITTVQDLNPNSYGYKDYFWFGLPFFDYRYEFPRAFESQDVGKEDSTGKYSLFLAGNEFMEKPVTVGNRVTVRFDILPYLKSAFEKTQQKGYMQHSTYENLALGAFNIGWEITGIYRAGVRIYDMSVEMHGGKNET